MAVVAEDIDRFARLLNQRPDEFVDVTLFIDGRFMRVAIDRYFPIVKARISGALSSPPPSTGSATNAEASVFAAEKATHATENW